MRSDGVALKGIGDHLLGRDFLKHADFDEMHEVAKRGLLRERFMGQKSYQISANGDPNLGFHSIQSVAKKVFDVQVLFEPFEEQLHLPTLLINGRNDGCIQVQTIGQDDQVQLSVWVVKAHPNEVSPSGKTLCPVVRFLAINQMLKVRKRHESQQLRKHRFTFIHASTSFKKSRSIFNQYTF